MPPGQERGHRGQFISAKQKAKRQQNSERGKQLNAERRDKSETSSNVQENNCTELEPKVALPTTPTILASPVAYNFMTGGKTPEIFRTSIHYSPNVPTDKVFIVRYDPQQATTDLPEYNKTGVKAQTIVHSGNDSSYSRPEETNPSSNVPCESQENTKHSQDGSTINVEAGPIATIHSVVSSSQGQHKVYKQGWKSQKDSAFPSEKY